MLPRCLHLIAAYTLAVVVEYDAGGRPVRWQSDNRARLELKPAPLDRRWIGFAKKIDEAVQAGALPADWNGSALFRWLHGHDSTVPSDRCSAWLPQYGRYCRCPPLPGLTVCRKH